MVIYFKFGNNVCTSARAFSTFFLIFKTEHFLLFIMNTESLFNLLAKFILTSPDQDLLCEFRS